MEKKAIDPSGAVGTLTPREREVFSYLLKGMKRDDIASQIGVSLNTFGFHNKNVYRKLQVRSRSELILRYIEYANLDTGGSK